MTVKKTKAGAQPASKTLNIDSKPGVSRERRLAEISLDPAAHAMMTGLQYNKGSFGEQDLSETYAALADEAKAVKAGDLSHQTAMLAGQASALNSIFTELARRAGVNMGEHLQATQLYMRLALKAQSQCRATIEALDRLANGHVQTVKHVHVGQGGQAVIADEFHHHQPGAQGGQQNGQSIEQPHATGTGATGAVTALPSPDPFGNGVPLPSGERQAAVQDAWGQG